MMPQDPVKSENDLGFMTEVDAEYVVKAQTAMGERKDSPTSDRFPSTRHSEDPTSMPQQRSSLLDVEREEFKHVIKDLISKEQADALQMEERILEKIKKRNLSKGWNRPSGAKVAPLKILASMRASAAQ